MPRVDVQLLFRHRCRDYKFILSVGDDWVCPICGTPYVHSYPLVTEGDTELVWPTVLFWRPWASDPFDLGLDFGRRLDEMVRPHRRMRVYL